MLPQSSVQISGSSSSTWASRSVAPTMSVPPAIEWQRRLVAAEHEIAAHPGGQVEHDVDAARADPLDGLRCTAPGLASRCRSRGPSHGCARPRHRPSPPRSRCQRSAPGVTGTLSLRPAVSPAPVTAQVMNASQFIRRPARSGGRGGVRCGRAWRLGAGDAARRAPDVDHHHRPLEPVQHRRGHAVGVILQLAETGAVPANPDLRKLAVERCTVGDGALACRPRGGGGSTASRSASGSQARNTLPEEVAWSGSERPIQFGAGTLGGSTWST